MCFFSIFEQFWLISIFFGFFVFFVVFCRFFLSILGCVTLLDVCQWVRYKGTVDMEVPLNKLYEHKERFPEVWTTNS